ALARELIRIGRLTKYQAGRAYRGKTKGLVLGDYVVLDDYHFYSQQNAIVCEGLQKRRPLLKSP
ncbi:MAG: hypothetical protein ACYTG0_45560, partial [Planctomycetota bacterium]